MSDCQVTPEIAAIIKEMAKNRLEAGHTDPRDIIDAIHAEIQDHTPLWKEEIAQVVREAIPGRKYTKSEAATRMAELKKQLRNEYGPSKSEKQNTQRQNKLKKDIADLQKKIDTKDYAPPEKRQPIQYNSETKQLEAARAKLQKKVDKEVRQLEYNNQTGRAKAVDTGFAALRASILSGVPTIAKLSSAALSRVVATTPIEQIAGSMLRHIPVVSGIAAKAPREGAGFSPSAEWGALKQTFSKDTLKQMYDTATTASGALDAMYGKDKHGFHKYLDVVGQIHGALKTPAKINEFTRSVAIRSKFERDQMIARGMTPDEANAAMQSFTTQSMIAAKAYEDGQRAIFMSDNAAVTAFKAATNVLGNIGKEGSTTRVLGGIGARTLEYLFPIVKVPTNVIAEAGSYAAGGAKALLQVGATLSKEGQRVAQEKALGNIVAFEGLRRMTGDQADYVMRNLKKQTLGAALMYIGYTFPQFIGGYYNKQIHKDEDDPKEGSIRVFGFEVPKVLLHTPAMEMLQLGATVAKVEQAVKEKVVAAQEMLKKRSDKLAELTPGTKAYDKKKLSVANAEAALEKQQNRNPKIEGVYEGVSGMVGQVPFFDTPKRLATAFKSTESVGNWASREASSRLVPAIVNDIAGMTDSETQTRKPSNFTEALKARIPVLREQVPVKSIKDAKGADAKMEMYQKASKEEKADMYDTLVESIKRSTSMSQDQKDRMLDRVDESYPDD